MLTADQALIRDFIVKTSDRTSVIKYAQGLEALDLAILMVAATHWRKQYVAEVYIERLSHLTPQDRVISYLEVMGSITQGYEPKVLSKRSIDTLVKKGKLVTVSHSRLRTDDMEMVYWTTIEIAPTELQKALT